MSEITDAVRLAYRVRPNESPVMYQSWHDLLFLHWKFEPAIIQPLLPHGLQVDTFDGSAWVGVVPFIMRRVRPKWSPSVPWLSGFPELNLRTYAVSDRGVPGVWFFSLDAQRLPAVILARVFFGLPYHWAHMSVRTGDDGFIHYRSRRFSSWSSGSMEYRYRPTGEMFQAKPGTLEFFLAERYILFAHTRQGHLVTGQVHHTPYPLQRAEVSHHDTRLLSLSGLSAPREPFCHALYSHAVDVEIFGLKHHRTSRESELSVSAP